MKRSNTKRSWVLSLLVVLGGLLAPAHCQPAGVALLIQYTPSQGGAITPSTGVHYFAPNSQVTLIATPRPGYRFLYWLGDVSDPVASTTVTYLDLPKIVIAVFEQARYGNLASGGGGGGGGVRTSLVARTADYSWQSSGIGGGPNPEAPPDKPRNGKPTPEPTTLLLLGLGAVMLRRK